MMANLISMHMYSGHLVTAKGDTAPSKLGGSNKKEVIRYTIDTAKNITSWGVTCKWYVTEDFREIGTRALREIIIAGGYIDVRGNNHYYTARQLDDIF